MSRSHLYLAGHQVMTLMSEFKEQAAKSNRAAADWEDRNSRIAGELREEAHLFGSMHKCFGELLRGGVLVLHPGVGGNA